MKKQIQDFELNPNPEEVQYLNLIADILTKGAVRCDRTGIGTISLFAPQQLRFSLSNNTFPLLTTKHTYFRGLAEELFWFIHGSTDAKLLQARNVKIWNSNGSREYLDKLGFTDREEGDLGPVYGFQWRHFGAKYINCHTDYTGQGVDQLKQVIEKIQNNPFDRRIILSAWNPSDAGLMALPPCHMFCQFYVSNFEGINGMKLKLSCQMYQRSCDIGLGVPFNIASYALLTRLIAHVCGIEAGDCIHVLGDAHVYSDHIEALKIQIDREPYTFPTLRINKPRGGGFEALLKMQYSDLEIVGYKAHPRLVMKMAV